MALYFITSSHGKFLEVSHVIPDLKHLELDLDEIQSLDPKVVIEHKLAQAASVHDGTFIVEDTSVSIDCLSGLPGTMVKWFLEKLGTDGIADLVSRYDNPTAHVQTTIGYRDASGHTHYFVGEYTGTIVSPRGDKGFGFDPIFVANGQSQTNAELDPEQKNRLSARGVAARKLNQHLKTTKY